MVASAHERYAYWRSAARHPRTMRNVTRSRCRGARLGLRVANLVARRPDPAGLRNVEVHVVRSDVAHLDVAVARRRAGRAESERDVDVLARLRRAGLLELRRGLIEALDLETDVMDAAPAR